jgi:adenylosuccinate synthase
MLERWLRDTDDVIFEGAQGVLIDAEAGFHPYTTWSNCTAANALEILAQITPDADTFQIGVVRSYAVRHGAGPLPTETDGLASLIAEHNQYNEWQGAVRYGWFDSVLARYALSVASGIDFLTVTHLDMLSHLEEWRYCSAYTDFAGLDAADIGAASMDGALTYLRYKSSLSLEERTQFTKALSKVTPVLEACRAEDKIVIQKLERLVGKPVGIVSDGPSAENVHILKSLLP